MKKIFSWIVGSFIKKEQHFSNRFRTIQDYDERLLQAKSDFRIKTFLSEAKNKLCWADVPCGVGVALYESVETFGEKIKAVGSDIVRWDESALSAEDMKELQKYPSQKIAGLLHKDAFTFIQGDMGTIPIPGGADLITSIGGIYYHPDPLSVWQNLYNQLHVEGVFACHFMFPKNNHELADTYKSLAELLKPYAESKISFSVDNRDVFETALVVRKTSGKDLKLHAPVKKTSYHVAKFGRHGKFKIMVVNYAPLEIG